MSILVTGGAGYIGSHTCVELLKSGEDIVVIDNFFNSKPQVIEKVKELGGKDFAFYEADVCDRDALEKIFSEHDIDSVIHFAGYKAVGESVAKPMMYYENNLGSTFALIDTMKKHGCKKLVFSSSATVYGEPQSVPVNETFPLSAISPYGRTKLMIEDICRDLAKSDEDWSIALLRYFNPIGAHESGEIGESPNGIPNNLMPLILRVAAGKMEKLNLFGNDYDTYDGTCVRDYIHVVDLALGHLAAIRRIRTSNGCDAYNLGTGHGYSVLDIINTFERVNEIKVPYEVVARRPGDSPAVYTETAYAEKMLGWKAERELEQMCRDSWRYAKKYM